jgi:hypothetical protein
MILEGTVRQDVIVLDSPVRLPDGTRVQVVVPEGEGQPTLRSLLKYSGALPDLPADFALQHDHYIHGTPKK